MKTTRLFASAGLILCLFAFTLSGCREAAIEAPGQLGPGTTEDPAVGVIEMGSEDGVKAPTKN